MKLTFLKYLLIGFLLLAIATAVAVVSFVFGGVTGKNRLDPFYDSVEAVDYRLKRLKRDMKGEGQNSKFVDTGMYELKLTSLEPFNDVRGDKAAFSPMGEKFIVATRSGELAEVGLNWPSSTTIEVSRKKIPTHKEAFLKAKVTKRHPRIPLQYGVKDLFVIKHQDYFTILASHHFWKEADECVVMRLSRIDVKNFSSLNQEDNDWKTIFETNPCLKFDGRLNRLGEDDTTLQSGGRMISYSENEVLMSVGDHFMDGIHNVDLAQDMSSTYGKTLIINIENGSHRVFTVGHRNPQGIYLDKNGEVWSTEHGPRGGDELNHLKAGSNYGWPIVSYGTLYSSFDIPNGKLWNQHEGFVKPKYHWGPATAVSNIIRLENTNFSRWEGDFITGSLAARSLFRIRLAEDAVISVEQIPLDFRIRDLQTTIGGNLLLMTDAGLFMKIEPMPTKESGVSIIADSDVQARGRNAWRVCAACHSLSPEKEHKIGPTLYGIYNKKIASSKGFEYSSALKSKNGKWDESALNRFLEDPQAFAPGNTMSFGGISGELERKLLVEYLKTINEN